MERFNNEKVAAEEIGILDNNSEWLGIPKTLLMECAGYSFALEIIQRYKLNESSKIVIFCGTGNNGGDGFVVARHLSSFNIKNEVILVGLPEHIRSYEARLNWDIISTQLIHSIEVKIIKDSIDLVKITEHVKYNNFDLIIDGLLGTGVKGMIREPISSAIEGINLLKKELLDEIKIISIDVPSGLDSNTGKVDDKAVQADLVITFHRNKHGMKANTEYIKEIVVKSIGIPPEASLFVGRGDVMPCLKQRKVDNHKGQHGRVLVIGGSKNYSGAPAFSSMAVIHFGCDLVITYVPEVVGDVIRGYDPNLIVRTSPGNWLNLDAFDEIESLIDWANAIIIGPGMGLEPETEDLLVSLIKRITKEDKRLVLDADALKLISNHLDLIKGHQVILTPHEGELNIMMGEILPPNDNLEERGQRIKEIAKQLDVTIVIKGPYDYISDGQRIKINRTGCPEMSIGGTGDVLAGLCGCFLTIENAPFESACAATFLNGYLGEYTKKSFRSRFTATDMIQNIDKAIKELEQYSL